MSLKCVRAVAVRHALGGVKMLVHTSSPLRFATIVAVCGVLVVSVTAVAQNRNPHVFNALTGEAITRVQVVDLRAETALFGPPVAIVSNQNRAAGIVAAANIGEAVVYQNGLDSGFGVRDNYSPSTGLLFPGTMNADNLGMEGGYAGEISRFEMAIFRSINDPLTGLGLATDLHIALWDGDPLQMIDTIGGGYAGAEVAGSGADFTIPANGLFMLSHTLPKGSGAINPTNRFWGTLSGSQTANPSSCRTFFILTLVKPRIGNDNPGDIWEKQFDNDFVGATCCGDRGTACSGAGGVCGPTGESVLCDDGDADGAFVFSFGGPCLGDNATDSCSNFLWNVFAPAAVTMSLVEAGTRNPEIVLEAGGVDVEMEIVISNFNPNNDGTGLRAFLAQIDSSGYTSAVTGTLTPTAPGCVTDADCKAIFGGVCGISSTPCAVAADCPFGNIEGCTGSTCNFPYSTGGFCQPGFMFTGRNNYVFKQAVGDLPAVDTSYPDYRYASAAQGGPLPSTSVIFPAYLGTLRLTVSPNAAGTFTIPLFGTPRSVLVNQAGQFIRLLGFNPGKITVETGQCCDLTGGSCGSLVCLGDDFTKADCDAVGGAFSKDRTCADPCGCILDSECDDGDACTVDRCDNVGTCLCDNSAPTDCSDGLICTDDFCDSATGCANPGVAVDDGDGCTLDGCGETTGVTHLPVDVDDGDPATVDSCDSATGVITHRNIDTFPCTTLADCPAGATRCDHSFCTIAEPVPAVSTWGLLALALTLLVGAKVYFDRRRKMQA